MVHINVIDDNPIVLDCFVDKDTKYFRLVIDPETQEILEKPDGYSMDVSIAYSRIFGFLMREEPLPERLSAEWG